MLIYFKIACNLFNIKYLNYNNVIYYALFKINYCYIFI